MRTQQASAYYVTYFVIEDRKSTRLNSSHLVISYAVFCLKKKKNNIITTSHELRLPGSTVCAHVRFVCDSHLPYLLRCNSAVSCILLTCRSLSHMRVSIRL